MEPRARLSACVCLIKYKFAFDDLYSVDCDKSGTIRKLVSVVPRGAIADVEADAAPCVSCHVRKPSGEKDPRYKFVVVQHIRQLRFESCRVPDSRDRVRRLCEVL